VDIVGVLTASNWKLSLSGLFQNESIKLGIGAGSVGWFTAMSLQDAAVVKTLGQTEFVVTLLISYFYFGESTTPKEYIGIMLITLSVILLMLVT